MARARRVAVAGKAPDLFPRGKKGVFYFRMLERGRDRWISTRTADRTEAAKVRNAILAGKGYGQSIARDERSAAKLARNLSVLARHPDLSDPMRQVIRNMYARWQETANAAQAQVADPGLWHPRPTMLQ